jgi:RHH-type proline utilization regulon transcriptional repressor/proline dehydrogenase/delta 1-pyrroline-5-carboxylate dehydrogenase
MPTFDRLYAALVLDETSHVKQLLEEINPSRSKISGAKTQALALAEHVRKAHSNQGGMDSFMSTYDLSSQEGIALMCLAEALLRIPDGATADRLIADKISKGDWESHLSNSDSLFVNVATMGLLLTGKVINPDPMATENWTGSLKGWFSRTSEPIIRQAIAQAMKILGKQYVLGETIEQAMKRAAKKEAEGFTYSYDMLGESARTEEHAEHYFEAYAAAIHAIGKNAEGKGLTAGPGISIKLSALHPRYEFSHWDDQFKFLLPRLLELAQLAKSYGIGFTVDAEEADRLELSLALFKAVAEDPSLAGWNGLGLAVQGYQKRARAVIDWLKELAIQTKRKIMVRLVKGAYWDSEIKNSQTNGFDYYPVFTRKMTTDVSYLTCAQKLLENAQYFYPQFATHNAFTVSAILSMVKPETEFEFQRLHGMGDALYDKLLGDNKHIRCRIYAPVGGHQYLLAYLVRRLLENGANTSFVNQVISDSTPIEDLIANPIEKLDALHCKPHPKIKLPRDLFEPKRLNSRGLDLNQTKTFADFETQLNAHYPAVIAARGRITGATVDAVAPAMKKAVAAHDAWSRQSLETRAALLNAMADALEAHRSELVAIAVKEAGKTVPNAIGEVREAVDFCRYYAAQALETLKPTVLPGPTGEFNQLSYRGRGVVICISPWNFPLAIFTGQLAAALVAGNTVIAKPAEQTSYMAYRAVQLFHKAGIPQDVLQLMIGSGSTVGSAMVAHPDVAGVIFTGSTEVAQMINQSLAAKQGAIVPLIAETGGQNTMIVDSTALLEQVVMDVGKSAFDSAGQRCSALRILCVQEDIADDLITMIKGSMDTLVVGDPSLLKTDVGPVIDAGAQGMLRDHIESMRARGFPVYQIPMTDYAGTGTFVPPTLIEIDSIHTLEREIFGPILHLVRYSANKVTQLIHDINSTGYGLTFGMHSRNESQYLHVVSRMDAGNAYINRNIVGAVVGVQPFGGEGLSGTGPKAGGPNYIMRLVHEHALSINTVAMGGNASLLSLADDEDLLSH